MKLNRPIYFVIFTLAIVALSWVFASWRDMWALGGNGAIGKFLLAVIWFGFLFSFLGFMMYEQEKRKGKVTHSVKLYEWLEGKGFRYE